MTALVVDIASGVDPAVAVQQLRELTTAVQNVRGGPRPVEQHRDNYLAWVERADTTLGWLFADSQERANLYNPHYWEIRNLREGSARPYPLIDAEVDRQAKHLESVADQIRQQAAAWSLPPGTVAVVPDTSVLVNYRRLEEVDWPSLTENSKVVIVLPLLVVDELDDLKYRDRRVGDRAARLIRFLRQLRRDARAADPVELRSDVTLKVLLDPPRHPRLANHDAEILDRAESLARFAGDVRLATGDYGMELRARERGLRVVVMPDELRLVGGRGDEATVPGTETDTTVEVGPSQQL